jgi:hypothetical protein
MWPFEHLTPGNKQQLREGFGKGQLICSAAILALRQSSAANKPKLNADTIDEIR